MRIRKNAKISALLYTDYTKSVSRNGDECILQKNLCQFNQSPWDIITFSSSDSSNSSFHKFDDYVVSFDVNCAANGSSTDSIGDFERKIVNNNIEGESDNFDDARNDHKENPGFEDQEMNEVQEEILLCDATDKKGWQCGRVVKNGETMCDRHIIKQQNRAVWTTKKNSGPTHGSVAGTRSRQPKKQASTSPYEFYYYSGFGPSWGKKRGTGSTSSKAYNEPAKVEPIVEKMMEMGSTDNHAGLRKEEWGRFEPGMSTERPVKMKLGYIDEHKTGKKRGRKPIKARSLKSLM